MRFENPAGLWLLLGIPVLIIIWIIRPQHENRPVSSSYIWALSDRFMKKRIPLNRLQKWLVFLLQLLMIIGAALIAAHPVHSNGTLTDYVVILDSSASMQTVTSSGKTRWDEAVEQAEDVLAKADEGHRVSIFIADNEAYCLLEEGSSFSGACTLLEKLSCGSGEADTAGVLVLVQLFCDEHPGAQVTLYTDCEAESAEGLTVVTINDEEWNAAITDVTFTGDTFYADVVSYGKDAVLNLGISLNGRLKGAVTVNCTSDVPQQAEFTLEGVGDEDEVTVYMEPNDALSCDNSYTVCFSKENACATLLVTDTPLYLESALTALDRGTADTLSTAEYAGQSGYDLYIFDGYVPSQLPSDGFTLLINPDTLPDGTELSDTIGTAALLSPSLEESELRDKLIKELQLTEITVSEHRTAECGDNWSALMNCGGTNAVIANDEGNCVALLFDLHDSNLPMLTDFLLLLRNAMNLAVPPLVETQTATVGSSVSITLPKGEKAVTVTMPDGETQSVTESGEIVPKQYGVYTVSAKESSASFFAHIPFAESRNGTLGALELTVGEQTDTREEAVSGIWQILACLILIILLAEWGLYNYEQY